MCRDDKVLRVQFLITARCPKEGLYFLDSLWGNFTFGWTYNTQRGWSTFSGPFSLRWWATPWTIVCQTCSKASQGGETQNELLKVNKEATSDVEFLVVSETCSVAWVPYTAGREMPLRVVTGGRKWNGQALLVAALWTTAGPIHNYRFGHYDPDDKIGYTYNKGVGSNESVDLLVEIWSRFRYVQMFFMKWKIKCYYWNNVFHCSSLQCICLHSCKQLDSCSNADMVITEWRDTEGDNVWLQSHSYGAIAQRFRIYSY